MIGTLRGLAHALQLLNPLIVIVVLVVGAALTVVRPAWARRWLLGMALIYWFLSTSMGTAAVVTPLARGFEQIQAANEASGAGKDGVGQRLAASHRAG